MSSSKKEYRSPSFKKDFMEKGSNAKKDFMTLLTRYGVKGYKLGWKVFEGVFADFFFKEKKLAIFVGAPLPDQEAIFAMEERGIFPLVLSDEFPSEEWFEGVAVVFGCCLTSLKVCYPWVGSILFADVESNLKRQSQNAHSALETV